MDLLLDDRGYDLIFYICFGGCFANRWRNDRAGDCYSRWCSYSCTDPPDDILL